MSDTRIFLGGIAAIGAALATAFFMVSNSSTATAQVQDTAGPNMVIELGGAAMGRIVIDLRADVAPLHVAQITALAESGAYDNVVFHRVIEGFMAQTGDVEHGKRDGDLAAAGSGGSSLPDIPAEFSALSFDRGTVGMARTSSPDSANSQFFIMFKPAPHLDGQYTIVGQVIEGMDVVDDITRGDPNVDGSTVCLDPLNCIPITPDYMAKVSIER